MMFDSTAGGSNSNSLVSVEEADAYFTTRLGGGAWAEVDEPEAALITATAELELKRYLGTKTDSDQALKWPRSGIYNEDGVLYDEDVIPARVKQACFELALELGQDPDSLSSSGLEGFKSIQTQETKFEMRDGFQRPTLPVRVTRLLKDFIVSDQARVIRA
jgi:hypothetical protein